MVREGSFRGAECVLGGAGGFRASKGFAWREDGFSMGETGLDLAPRMDVRKKY